MPKSRPNPSKQPVKPQYEVNSSPAWPALRPLVPATDLQLETLLEDQIVIIRKFFTKALCQRYVSFLSSLPLVTTPGKPKKGEALRINDRYQVQDPDFAKLLYKSTCLEDLIQKSPHGWGGKVLGLNPNIRIYRYTPGQFFAQHYDESNQILLGDASGSKAKTTWTLLLYLTDSTTGCYGGETVFYPEPESVKHQNAQLQAVSPTSVAPELGMLLLHKHGDDCLLHEGKEVIAGEKWIIRTDLYVAQD